MRLADLSVPKRRETVIIAARVVLARTAGETHDEAAEPIE